MEMRTGTGARILEVFWMDEDRNTAGLLVEDMAGTQWASEWSSLTELRAGRDDLRAAAQVVIEGGKAHRSARS